MTIHQLIVTKKHLPITKVNATAYQNQDPFGTNDNSSLNGGGHDGVWLPLTTLEGGAVTWACGIKDIAY